MSSLSDFSSSGYIIVASSPSLYMVYPYTFCASIFSTHDSKPNSFNFLYPPGCKSSPTIRFGSAQSRSTHSTFLPWLPSTHASDAPATPAPTMMTSHFLSRSSEDVGSVNLNSWGFFPRVVVVPFDDDDDFDVDPSFDIFSFVVFFDEAPARRKAPIIRARRRCKYTTTNTTKNDFLLLLCLLLLLLLLPKREI